MAPFRRFSLNAWYACYGRMAHLKFESDLRNPAVIGGASSFSPLNISIDVKPIDRVQHFAAAVPIELWNSVMICLMMASAFEVGCGSASSGSRSSSGSGFYLPLTVRGAWARQASFAEADNLRLAPHARSH